MISHILVPLDGSALAECVLPHVEVITSALDARVTLLHALEHPHKTGGHLAIDPLEWHLKKSEAGVYLDRIRNRMEESGLKKVKNLTLEGSPADCIIDFANHHAVDLIALSSHGRSGLSGWNVSSVVQKIISRSYKSILLVRAYKSSLSQDTDFRYTRLFVGLDCSARAEFILPVAISLAQFTKAQLIVGTVVHKPEMLQRFPLSKEDAELVNRVADRNYRVASRYFEQLHSQVSTQGMDLQTRLVVSDHTAAALHDIVNQEKADLSMLVAHGQSGENRWPYGSVTANFITYGNTPLFIMQDLSSDEVQRSETELIMRETKGH